MSNNKLMLAETSLSCGVICYIVTTKHKELLRSTYAGIHCCYDTEQTDYQVFKHLSRLPLQTDHYRSIHTSPLPWAFSTCFLWIIKSRQITLQGWKSRGTLQLMLSKMVTSKVCFCSFTEEGGFIRGLREGGLLDWCTDTWMRKRKWCIGFRRVCFCWEAWWGEGHSVRACLTCGLVGWLDGWFVSVWLVGCSPAQAWQLSFSLSLPLEWQAETLRQAF